ncbi:MAG: hypothetical protein IH965_08930 [Gemmatimonadetes bacterium]|nr:hypothetical protein [Gemmatimonadota bacterium]
MKPGTKELMESMESPVVGAPRPRRQRLIERWVEGDDDAEGWFEDIDWPRVLRLRTSFMDPRGE